jgi:hypothetical protein
VTTIVVQHAGGSLITDDGLRLATSVNVFPEAEAFKPDEEVLLFLIYSADVRAHRIAGEFGAYRIKNGMAALMTRRAAVRRGDNPTSSAELFAALLQQQ